MSLLIRKMFCKPNTSPNCEQGLPAQDPPDIMMGQPAQYPDIIDSGYVMDISNNPLLKKIRLLEGDLLDASYKGKV